MTDRLAAVGLRVLAPMARLLGTGDEDALQNVDTTELPDGAICWVQDQATPYVLHRTSTAPPSGNVIVAPTSGPGRWIPLSISGGAGIAVPNIAALEALPAPTDGMEVFVESVRSDWAFELGSALVADGITVVADNGATGKWVRSVVPSLSWAYQAAWFVNATTGDDENTGLTSLLPLASWEEIRRRLNGQMLMQTTDVQVLTDLAEYMRLSVSIQENPGGTPYRLVVRTPSTTWTQVAAGTAGTFTGVTALSRTGAGGNMTTVTDAALTVDPTTFLGKRVRITSAGPRLNATAWVIKRFSATSFGTTPFMLDYDPLTQSTAHGTNTTPVIADAYVIEDVPGILGFEFFVDRQDVGSGDVVVACIDSFDVMKNQSSADAQANGFGWCEVSGAQAAQYGFVGRSHFFARAMAGPNSSYNSCLGEGLSTNGFNGGAQLIYGGGIRSTSGTLALSTSRNSVTIDGDFTAIGTLWQPATTLIAFVGDAGFFDSPSSAIALANAGFMIITGALYGTGNVRGLSTSGGGIFVFQTGNRPTIAGTNVVQMGGQNFANWTQFPLSDPFKMVGVVAAGAGPGRASVYTTGIAAPIAATDIFSSVPDKGMYIIEAYIATTTVAAGDTVTLTITWTDDSQAETSNIINASSLTALGFAQASIVIETDGVTMPQFALSFPTHTGAPAVSLRLSARQMQSAGV